MNDEFQNPAGETPALPGGKRPALPAEGRGWYSRGYLPHFDAANRVQAITFRLGDSLPTSTLAAMERELAHLPDAEREVERRRAFEAALDAGHGECWLRKPEIAKLVENALLHFDGNRYRLVTWCIMPNHVHAMIAALAGHNLEKVLHSWKSFTAKEANRLLGRHGQFWMAEYHDRFIRDEEHFRNALRYIEQNPVKAGLVKRAKDWPFGSARKRQPPGSAGVSPA